MRPRPHLGAPVAISCHCVGGPEEALFRDTSHWITGTTTAVILVAVVEIERPAYRRLLGPLEVVDRVAAEDEAVGAHDVLGRAVLLDRIELEARKTQLL